uniref:Carotenoid cleavage dioxygenase 4 n=2 Tax=Kalanchoe fedtschenkoi TaxID=63787 RepID=A0A7N0U015_KALFE
MSPSKIYWGRKKNLIGGIMKLLLSFIGSPLYKWAASPTPCYPSPQPLVLIAKGKYSHLMDAFSSSFIPKMPHPTKRIHTPNLSTLAQTIPHISSVRIEDRKATIPPSTTPPTPKQGHEARRADSRSAQVSPRPVKQQAAMIRSQPVQQTLPVVVFNLLDNVINNFVDPPLRPSVDPKHVLSDNFAPVEELPPTRCEVISGSLPSCLDGVYIRNGPNPQFLPRGPYHLFDGDGMLHSIRISKGEATFCSRYVRTYKYKVEKAMGSPVIPNVFSGFNGLTASAARGSLAAFRALTGQFNPVNGIGLANTSLAHFGNRLYALGESDLPYEVRVTQDGDIETVGRQDFDGQLFMSMTAHPKMDTDTGETFAFRYGPIPPFLTYFHFNPNGKKQQDVPIFSMTSPSFLHDFAMTKTYAIFAESQICMNPMEMIKGGSPVGADLSKVPRLGILPRYAKDESRIRWFDVPGFNIVHAINAWDEGPDEIVLVAPNILSVEHTLERLELIHASIEKVRINLKTGHVSRQPVSSKNLDFAVINPSYISKRNQYVYAAIGDPMPKITGVVKLDVSMAERNAEAVVGIRSFGEGCFGGEPFFVAKDPKNTEAEEDEGYLISYVHNERTGESRFLVMDAKSPSLEVVAAVRLPARVPYGFHGLFVSKNDLNNLARVL